MASTMDSAVLRLRNQSTCPVQVRFRCDSHTAWDGWCAAGGELEVPEPRPAALVAGLVWRDPDTQVGYRLPARPAPPGSRLVAGVRQAGPLRCFDCDSGPGSQPALLELLNRTAAGVQFVLAFAGTPFEVRCAVAPGALVQINPRAFDLAVLLDGISCREIPVTAWRGTADVTAVRLHGTAGPRLQLAGA